MQKLNLLFIIGLGIVPFAQSAEHATLSLEELAMNGADLIRHQLRQAHPDTTSAKEFYLLAYDYVASVANEMLIADGHDAEILAETRLPRSPALTTLESKLKHAADILEWLVLLPAGSEDILQPILNEKRAQQKNGTLESLQAEALNLYDVTLKALRDFSSPTTTNEYSETEEGEGSSEARCFKPTSDPITDESSPISTESNGYSSENELSKILTQTLCSDHEG